MSRFLTLCLRSLALLLVASTTSSCFLFASDDDDGSVPMEATPPATPAVAYGSNKIRLLDTIAMTPLAPTVQNAMANRFDVDPDLPAGLVFDEDTGEISGTPAGVSAPTDYTVTAQEAFLVSGFDPNGDPVQNEVVNDLATTDVCIEVLPAAPPQSLSYATNPAVYARGLSITPNVPSLVGVATQFTIAPALPGGMVIDAVTGVVSGSPSQESPPTDYLITASNPFGSTMTTLNLRVQAQFEATHVLVGHADDTLSFLRPVGIRRAVHRTHRVLPSEPVAVASTGDGALIYTACASGEILLSRVSAVTRHPDRGTVVATGGGVTRMAVDALDSRLITLGAGLVSSFEILPDGTLGTPEQLPVSIQAFAMDVHPSAPIAFVVDSGDAAIATFEVLPTLRVAAPEVAAPGYPSAIAVDDAGRFAYVIDFTGQRVHAFSIAAQVTAGAAPLALVQSVDVDPTPTDLVWGRNNVYVAHGDNGGISLFDASSTTGMLSPASSPKVALGRSFDRLAAARFGELYALDVASEEVVVVDQFFLSIEQRVRTRRSPRLLALHRGPKVFEHTQWVLATSPDTDELSALELTYADGSLTPTVQGAVGTGERPTGVEIDVDRAHVYVANRTDGTVSTFDFDPTDGMLTNRVDLAVGGNPTDLVLDATGSFLYVSDESVGAVLVLAVDPSDGSLSIASNTGPVLEALSAIGIDPTGQFLYALDPGGEVAYFRIDERTGALALGGTQALLSGAQPMDVAFSVHARDLYVADAAIGRIHQLAITAADGRPVAYSPPFVVSGSTTLSLATHPDRSEVYALGDAAGVGRLFDYGDLAGTLTERVAGSPYSTDARPVIGVVGKRGTFLITGHDDPSVPSLSVHSLVSGTGIGVTYFNSFDAGDGPPAIVTDTIFN